MHDINIASCDSLEWPDLVFAVLEISLLVSGQRTAQRLRNSCAQRVTAFQRKQLQPTIGRRRLQRERRPDRKGHAFSRAKVKFSTSKQTICMGDTIDLGQ